MAGDFNMIRFLSMRSRECRLSSIMKRFSEVIEDLEFFFFLISNNLGLRVKGRSPFREVFSLGVAV